MLGLGADREILRDHLQCRLCLAGAHAARARHPRRLRPAQERDREALRPRAPGAARHGDDGLRSSLPGLTRQSIVLRNKLLRSGWMRGSSPRMTTVRILLMDSVGRLILRFILIPLGYFAAVVAGTLVIVIGSWKLGPIAVTSDPDAQAVAVFGFVFAAPILLVMLLSVMWLPASIGILISEAFAIRSWMFHAGNGAVSGWIGWSLFGYVDATRVPLNEPLPVLAAGLAAGLAYWLIAGSS